MLLMAVYWLLWAICDLFKLSILRGSVRFAAPEKGKTYRTWRGILFPLLSMILAAGFIAERIYQIRLSFGQGFLSYGLPYAVILLGFFF